MVELLKRDGYILSRSDNPVPGTVDKFVYMITTEELPDVIAKRWTTNEEWEKTDLANDFSLFAESSVYNVFNAFIKKDTSKVKKSISYKKVPDIEEFVSLFDDDYDEEENWNKKPKHGTYSFGSKKPVYQSYNYYDISKDEAIKKYCNSNTLCFHKTDPTTTMLEQIYAGKGWDVVRTAYEMSPDTISELIDRHERIVMLGHGSPNGLIGFITPEHASHLEPKKLFCLWCNADAYCRSYLPNKKGFFACGNMPSDDSEARWVGYHVSHKYMDDNITYWCKLCGDVVEQCLEGDADAGCKYIRDKYWEKYHSGSRNEVGITKYNYVRTKVAGQDNLPEPTGEEITREDPKPEPRKGSSWFGGNLNPVTKVSYPSHNKEILLGKTTTGFALYTREDWQNCSYINIKITDVEKNQSRYSVVINNNKEFKTVDDLFNALKKQTTNYDLGDLKVETKETLIKKHTQTLINEGIIKEGEQWPEDIDPEIFEYVEFVNEDNNTEEVDKQIITEEDESLVEAIDLNIPEGFSVDDADYDFNKDEATVFCTILKNNEEVAYLDVYSSFEITDVDFGIESSPATYDSPAEEDIEITSNIKDIFTWDITYKDLNENEISRDEFIQMLNLTDEELQAIEMEATNKASEKISEKVEDYIYENAYDLLEADEPDYEEDF